MPPTHPMTEITESWIKKIQSETNGRVQIDLFSAGTLIGQQTAWDELRKGIADIGQFGVEANETVFPIGQALQVYIYQVDLKGARQVWDEIRKEFPEVDAEHAAAHMLFSYGQPSMYMHSKKPVRTLDDFKGLQVSPPAGLPELASKLGATGGMLPFIELYPSLDKGIIDGTLMPADPLQAMNFVDITDYSTNLHMPAPPQTFFSMNLDSWNRLPPDIQKVFDDNAPWMNTEQDNLMLKMEQDSVDFAKAKGHEFIELSAEDLNKLYGLREELCLEKAAELDAKGLPGTNVFNEVQRLVEEYNAKK